MEKHTLIILFTFLTTIGFSQIHEIGVFMGGSNFIGDVGSTKYLYPNHFGGGFVYKYNYNPRVAIRANYNFIGIKGDDSNSSNLYRRQRGHKFFNTINEFAIGVEFNFYEYNIMERNTFYTPYILTQLAVFNYKTPIAYTKSNLTTQGSFSYTVPVGVGFKGRLGDNVAFAFETAVRFTLKDDLDYSTNKIKALNFGGRGNDAYVFTAFSIVYTFGRPPCYYFLE